MAAISTPALLTQRSHETQASVSEPLRVLRVLRDLRLLHPLLPQHHGAAKRPPTAQPSEHTHIESTCRRSRRTPQVQFSLSTPHESSVAGQPATASGVAIIYVYLGAPGMSPTPRSAKYPATHSCHRLRGGGNARLRSSAPPSAENKSDPSDWSDRSDQSDGTMALFHIATTHPLKTAFLF